MWSLKLAHCPGFELLQRIVVRFCRCLLSLKQLPAVLFCFCHFVLIVQCNPLLIQNDNDFHKIDFLVFILIENVHILCKSSQLWTGFQNKIVIACRIIVFGLTYQNSKSSKEFNSWIHAITEWWICMHFQIILKHPYAY